MCGSTSCCPFESMVKQHTEHSRTGIVTQVLVLFVAFPSLPVNLSFFSSFAPILIVITLRAARGEPPAGSSPFRIFLRLRRFLFVLGFVDVL